MVSLELGIALLIAGAVLYLVGRMSQMEINIGKVLSVLGIVLMIIGAAVIIYVVILMVLFISPLLF